MLTIDEIREELIRQLGSGDVRGAAVARALGIPPPRVTEMKKRQREVQPDEMAALVRLLKMGEGAPAETRTPQPTLPNAADFAQILDALAPLASASRENEAELQELGAHFRAMIELRLQHPDYSMERILGSLDERLRARVDQVAPPA